MKALELQNIRKSHNDRAILDVQSLEIEKGQRVAVVGPNGSGKTTLLTVAAMLTKPDSGTVKVLGEPVDWRKKEKVRGHLGYMAQEPYFFRGSLQKNLEFAFSGNGISNADRLTRIEKYASMLGLKDVLNRSPRTFSSGERKRAAIARTLIREPSILILDEPFTFIDSASAAVLEEAIKNLSKDRTLVFSTHDLSNAYKLADRIITLQSGKVSPWTPENVFRLTASRTDDGYELLTEAGLSVYYPGDLEDGKEYIVSVNTNEVLASMQPIETSARNSYNGVIQKIEKSGTRTVLVTVNCGSGFQLRVTLTDRAMKELGLGVGDELWVHFKSTAVHVHQ